MLIPKREIVEFMIKEILNKKRIRSQKELADAVSKKLKTGDEGYAITPKRARMIALETPGVRVKVKTKKGKVPKKCPACERKLKKVYTKNLKGRKVLVSMKCSRCSYRGSGNSWVPSRYEFEISKRD